MRNYVEFIRENGKYHRPVLGLEKDDLTRLENYKFNEFMNKHNGQLCTPLSNVYKNMETILKEPISANRMIKFSSNIVEIVGINDFMLNVLSTKCNPPTRKDLLECFAKGLACTCCIDCKLYNLGD